MTQAPDPVETVAATPKRSKLWWWIGIPVAFVLLVIVGFLIWALTPLGPGPTATATLEGTDTVEVTQESWGWQFAPRGEEPTTGVVLYPGGRVDARSYAPLAAAIAQNGHVVAIVKVPLNLAILGANAADKPLAGNQQVEAWIMSGHSLGGVAAAQYVFANNESIRGLALLASYPLEDTDMSSLPIAATSVLGTEDGVIDRESYERSPELLPGDTEFVNIRGGNHAQFGDYGEQPGDNVADVTPAEQVAASAAAIERLFPRVQAVLGE